MKVPLINDLSAARRCPVSGVPEYICEHCLEDAVEEFPTEYEIKGRTFPAQFSGSCTIDYDHKIRKGDFVGRVQFAHNPLLVVQGVACNACVRVLPTAR